MHLEANDELPVQRTEVLPGIWRFRLGVPEQITPVQTRRYQPAEAALADLPEIEACPVGVQGWSSPRGSLLSLPLAAHELVYGFGLQLLSFQQRGLKKTLRVNADARLDTGDSHAPVPFYVTSRGYGVLIDTARYASFYCGSTRRAASRIEAAGQGVEVSAAPDHGWLPEAYKRLSAHEAGEVLIDVPHAPGVDVYIFGGPALRQAVQRYNLFSGGGPLVPRWGLGFWYRCKTDFDENDVLRLAEELRERRIPCDVLGLEPGWQTRAYSCSFAWSHRFPRPAEFMERLAERGFHVNLWEHAFTHPESSLYDSLRPHAGDFTVWHGLVPDFLVPEARKQYGDYHDREHVALGASGYKLDECDNSDYTGHWSFPESSRFPSGADGEQMHSLFGLRYQDAVQSVFEKRRRRTYGLVRNTQALAAPYPYVLYSDLYDHEQFIRGIAQASFSGLLWAPEVRHAAGAEDLIRRLQSVVFSPLAMVNAWYLKNPPWKQVNADQNNAGDIEPGWEQTELICREIINLRMRFLPYLHAAFVRYHRTGMPVFRAMIMDYPDAPETWWSDDQYMMGDDVLVAPVVAGQAARSVYLPSGEWFNFWTNQRLEGGQRLKLDVPLEQIPLFVRAGTVLPMAQPSLHTGDSASLHLSVYVYGDGARPCTLYLDDGGWAPTLREFRIAWDHPTGTGQATTSNEHSYQVLEWRLVS